MQYRFTHLIPPPPWIHSICATEAWLPILHRASSALQKQKKIQVVPWSDWDQRQPMDAIFLESPLKYDTTNQHVDLSKTTQALTPNGLLVVPEFPVQKSRKSKKTWKRQAIGLSLRKLEPRGFQIKRNLRNLRKKINSEPNSTQELLLFLKNFRNPKTVTIALPITGEKNWHKQVLRWIRFFEEYRLYEKAELMLIFDGMEAILPYWTAEEKFWQETSALMSVRHYQAFGRLQCFLSAVQFSQAKFFFWVEDPTIPCYEIFSLLDTLFEIQISRKAKRNKKKSIWVTGKKVSSDITTGLLLGRPQTTSFFLLDDQARTKMQSLQWKKQKPRQLQAEKVGQEENEEIAISSSPVLNYCNRRLFWKRSQKKTVFLNQKREM